MDEKDGIMTWVDKDILELVGKGVQVGAFSKKENAEALVDQLQKARFKPYLKHE